MFLDSEHVVILKRRDVTVFFLTLKKEARKINLKKIRQKSTLYGAIRRDEKLSENGRRESMCVAEHLTARL